MVGDKESRAIGTVQRRVAIRQRGTTMGGQPMDKPRENEVAVTTNRLFQQ